MIEVQGLIRRYGPRTAVDGLSFSVAGGEILGLVGPNGAGKTTTLRILAGVIAPTAGLARVAGHDVRTDPIDAKRALALVPDDPHLFASLTVWEHLDLAAQLYDVAGWQDRAEALLGELDLIERRNALATQLSRGMRQKVAVAAALLHEPRVLLLDEPLTGLDPRGIRTLFGAVERCAARGSAVVLSSHLLGQIERLCTRFLILRAGRRLFLGSKQEIAGQLETLRHDASLEEIFFQATEDGA